MNDSVQITIVGCDKCPNMKMERYYTEDSWDDIVEWKCDATPKQKRITLHEWNDPKPQIPIWCPLRGEKQHDQHN